MKLRNKKTGEINKGDLHLDDFNSLAELNEEWEDYDPNEYWYIDTFGKCDISFETVGEYKNIEAFAKEIGNYFETKEEAEKAVEKLKAWKRLKDKGVEFYGWRRNQTGTYELYLRWEDRIPRSYEVKNDLDLLFGGEE